MIFLRWYKSDFHWRNRVPAVGRWIGIFTHATLKIGTSHNCWLTIFWLGWSQLQPRGPLHFSGVSLTSARLFKDHPGSHHSRSNRSGSGGLYHRSHLLALLRSSLLHADEPRDHPLYTHTEKGPHTDTDLCPYTHSVTVCWASQELCAQPASLSQELIIMAIKGESRGGWKAVD